MFFPLPNISIASSIDLGNNEGIACGSALQTGEDIGEWFHPDGSMVRAVDTGDPVYVLNRINHVVLHMRVFFTSLEGIYTCRIPDENRVVQSLYVGIYTDESYQGDGQFFRSLSLTDH